jgi:hypothetical protein
MLVALPLLAAGASLSSCGTNSDHISGVTVSVSPDPIEKGASFTIRFDGTLDEDLSTINANVDLDVSVFGLIKKHVSAGGNVALSPAVPKGALSVTVGPVDLSTSVSGSVDVSGKIELTDGNNEPVACLEVDMKVPVAQQEQELEGVEGTSNCGKASDHAKDLVFQDTDGVTTITGELDESISQFAVSVDMEIKEFFIKIPISIKAPVAYSPGFPEGAFKVVATPTTSELSSELGVSISGKAIMTDANNEEVACVAFSDSESKSVVV